MKVLIHLGLRSEHHHAFSELICERCFIKIIEFEKFRSQCFANQMRVEKEMSELDAKINETSVDDYFGDEITTIFSWYDIDAQVVVNEEVEEKNFHEIALKIEPDLKDLTDLQVKNEVFSRDDDDEHEFMEVEVENEAVKEMVFENETIVEADEGKICVLFS
jgi:hypothetical protein